LPAEGLERRGPICSGDADPTDWHPFVFLTRVPNARSWPVFWARFFLSQAEGAKGGNSAKSMLYALDFAAL
jgi:hypothetical protein